VDKWISALKPRLITLNLEKNARLRLPRLSNLVQKSLAHVLKHGRQVVLGLVQDARVVDFESQLPGKGCEGDGLLKSKLENFHGEPRLFLTRDALVCDSVTDQGEIFVAFLVVPLPEKLGYRLAFRDMVFIAEHLDNVVSVFRYAVAFGKVVERGGDFWNGYSDEAVGELGVLVYDDVGE
jgi:hypothetical protein